MNTSPDYIPDIDNELNGISRMMPVLLWTIAGFVLIMIIDLFWENFMRGGSIPMGAAVALSVIAAIPLASLILLKKKKKAGWIIALLFFGFMVMQLSVFLARKLFWGRYFNFESIADLYAVLAFAMSAFIVILLVGADIRKALTIEQKMFVISLSIITVVDITLLLLIWKDRM